MPSIAKSAGTGPATHLHELNVGSDTWQWLSWQGVQRRHLWPILLTQPQHDLQLQSVNSLQHSHSSYRNSYKRIANDTECSFLPWRSQRDLQLQSVNRLGHGQSSHRGTAARRTAGSGQADHNVSATALVSMFC